MEERNETIEELETCDICGTAHPVDDLRMVEGQLLCPECMDEYTTICDCCGAVVLLDNTHIYGWDTYCDDCFENNFERCADCGAIVPRDELEETISGRMVCHDCRMDNYYNCHCCGELVHIDSVIWDDCDNPYCCSCYEEESPDIIHNYHYKPYPIFYGAKQYSLALFMGVELEIDKGGENSRNARQIVDIMNAENEYIYCKHDGSLSRGFEIVSHPATLEYHCNCMPWSDLMCKAVEMGYRSHDTDTCGLHVHVSRDSLGNKFEEQEDTISKIVYFVEKHWNELVTFTRRKSNNIEHWASRYGIENNSIKDTYKKAKDDYSRYHAVNLQNTNTIEFRIFRGTLKHSTFIATLQFVSEICSYCKVVSLDTIEDSTWSDFVGGIAESYTELHNYLTERGLHNV